MANPQFGRPMAGHLINNETVLQAITVDPSGRLYLAPNAGGGLGYQVEGLVDDGTAVGATKPLLLGASLLTGATNKALRTHPFSDDGNSAATNALIVQANLRVLNSGGGLDRMRGANAASGTTGTGVFGAGILVYNTALGMWTVAKGDNTAQFIHGPVAEGISTAGVNPLPLGAANSGVIRPLAALSQSSDGTSLGTIFGLESNSVIRLVNPAGTSDRMRTVAAASGSTGLGLLGAGCLMLDSDDSAKFKPLHIAGVSSQGLSRSLAVGPMIYNGATLDLIKSATAASGTTGVGLPGTAKLLHDPNVGRYYPEQSNFEGTAIASGSYTSTQVSPAIINLNARGIMIYLDINANPGAAETLSIDVQVICPISNAVQSVLPGTVISTATNGLFIQQIYPGAVETAAVTAFIVQGVALPRLFRLRVVHSASGSWNYSLTYCFIR